MELLSKIVLPERLLQPLRDVLEVDIDVLSLQFLHIFSHLIAQVLQSADLFLGDSGLGVKEDGFKRVELIGKGWKEVLSHVQLGQRLFDYLGLTFRAIPMHLVEISYHY